jgi:hypothetical protein
MHHGGLAKKRFVSDSATAAILPIVGYLGGDILYPWLGSW